MIVEIIPCLSDNYSYLIHEKETGTVSIVDPSEFNTCDKIVNKYKKLDFILNTHHHADHVGANLELKKKYNSKIVAFEGDGHRIPNVDILVKDQENWIGENFKSKIIHIPGHTSGHICFYFENEKIAFTGDTLFSLGCGRIFEGSYEEMFLSLDKLKKLPKETKIYCGHEYTYKNAEFCIKYDSDNINLKKKFEEVKKLISKNKPTVPSNLDDELKSNIFLRCNKNDLKIKLNMENQEDFKVFRKVRDLKDSF